MVIPHRNYRRESLVHILRRGCQPLSLRASVICYLLQQTGLDVTRADKELPLESWPKEIHILSTVRTRPPKPKPRPEWFRTIRAPSRPTNSKDAVLRELPWRQKCFSN